MEEIQPTSRTAQHNDDEVRVIRIARAVRIPFAELDAFVARGHRNVVRSGRFPFALAGVPSRIAAAVPLMRLARRDPSRGEVAGMSSLGHGATWPDHGLRESRTAVVLCVPCRPCPRRGTAASGLARRLHVSPCRNCRGRIVGDESREKATRQILLKSATPTERATVRHPPVLARRRERTRSARTLAQATPSRARTPNAVAN